MPASFGFYLLRDLTALSSLEELSLIIPHAGVMDDALFQALCETCTQMPRLKRVSLDVSANNLCEIGAAIGTLGDAQRLDFLRLCLARNPLVHSQTHGMSVVNALKKLPVQLNRLTELWIDLSGCGLQHQVKNELAQHFQGPFIPARCRVRLVLGLLETVW